MTRRPKSPQLPRRAALVAAMTSSLGWTLTACPKDQRLVVVGGEPVDTRTIDQHPLDLLPTGALLVSHLEAERLFQSSLGASMGQVVQNLLPLGPESNFLPQRDVKQVYGGAYAMQGADFVAVLQGSFDPSAIERAAQARAATPSGQPLVRTQYGAYALYTVANMGFVVLTANTIVTGNETGMRRVLDRLRYGQLGPTLAPWMQELINQERQGAAFVVVGDVGDQGVVEAASPRLPFVAGLRYIRVLGNFEPPGMNLVGSLTYGDDAQAKYGAEGLAQVQQMAYFASLLSTFGFGGQVPPLDVTQQGKDVAFAAKIDTSLAAMVMNMFVAITRPGG